MKREADPSSFAELFQSELLKILLECAFAAASAAVGSFVNAKELDRPKLRSRIRPPPV
jgi:hypothetical protein